LSAFQELELQAVVKSNPARLALIGPRTLASSGLGVPSARRLNLATGGETWHHSLSPLGCDRPLAALADTCSPHQVIPLVAYENRRK